MSTTEFKIYASQLFLGTPEKLALRSDSNTLVINPSMQFSEGIIFGNPLNTLFAAVRNRPTSSNRAALGVAVPVSWDPLGTIEADGGFRFVRSMDLSIALFLGL